MQFENLNDANVIPYAIKHYDNPNASGMDEFYADFNIIKYLKRLLNKYERTGELSERLILNHIIIFCNVFGPVAGPRLLFYKLDPQYHSTLKTFLIYLHMCPDTIQGAPQTINVHELPLDGNVLDVLRKI